MTSADDRRLDVSALGIEPAGTSRRGPGRAPALAAMLLVLLAGCAGIVVVTRLGSAWRAAESVDGADGEATPAPAGAPPPGAPVAIVPEEGGRGDLTAARGPEAEPFARAARLPR